MAVPKRKNSKSRSRKRQAGRSLKPMQLAYCSQCGTPAPTHVVCPNCGFYQGRTLVETSATKG